MFDTADVQEPEQRIPAEEDADAIFTDAPSDRVFTLNGEALPRPVIVRAGVLWGRTFRRRQTGVWRLGRRRQVLRDLTTRESSRNRFKAAKSRAAGHCSVKQPVSMGN